MSQILFGVFDILVKETRYASKTTVLALEHRETEERTRPIVDYSERQVLLKPNKYKVTGRPVRRYHRHSI